MVFPPPPKPTTISDVYYASRRRHTEWKLVLHKHKKQQEDML